MSRSLGDSDGGPTFMELLTAIKAFEEYQHTRNHDMINALISIKFNIEELVRKNG